MITDHQAWTQCSRWLAPVDNSCALGACPYCVTRKSVYVYEMARVANKQRAITQKQQPDCMTLTITNMLAPPYKQQLEYTSACV